MQILLSQAVYNKIQKNDIVKEKNRFVCLGRFEMPDAADRGNAKVWEFRVPGLEARFFGGITRKGDGDDDTDGFVTRDPLVILLACKMFMVTTQIR